MYFQENTVDDTSIKQAMELAAEALAYSAGKYAAFASLPKIRIVFASRPYSDGAGVTPAFTYTEFFNSSGEFCPILLYPALLTFSREHQMQIVAHETYHCIQKVAWPAKVTAAVTGRSEGEFWFESIAQLMSNVVYPNHDFEYHPMFGRFDQHLPLMTQESPYLSEGFFQGLFWRLGAHPNRMHLLQNVFRSGTPTAVEDLRSIPNIEQHHHEIARDMAFQQLRDNSGALVQWRIEMNEITVPSTPTSNFRVDFMDFSTEPFEIIFPKRGRYRVRAQIPEGSTLSVRKVGSPTWLSSFPSEFEVDCNDDRKLEGIITRAKADLAMNTATFEVERVENDTCPCIIENKPNDSCLFGEWVVDQASVIDFLHRATSENLEIISVAGTVRLTFTPDGDHSWKYDNLVVHGRPRMQSTPVDIRMFWNGMNTFTYSNFRTEERTSVCSKAQTSGLTARAEGIANGIRFTMPVPIEPIRGDGVLNYHCSGNTFSYDIQAGRIPLNWIFHRVE